MTKNSMIKEAKQDRKIKLLVLTLSNSNKLETYIQYPRLRLIIPS